MACPNGSEVRPQFPGNAIIRVSSADFSAEPLFSRRNEFGIAARSDGNGYDVDLTTLLAPDRISEYGVVYSNLLFDFCASEPPTEFPGAIPAIASLAAIVARRRWNQFCRCLPPQGEPLPDGRGRCSVPYLMTIGQWRYDANNPNQPDFYLEQTTSCPSQQQGESLYGYLTNLRIVNQGEAFTSNVAVDGFDEAGNPKTYFFGDSTYTTRSYELLALERCDGEPDVCDFFPPVPAPPFNQNVLVINYVEDPREEDVIIYLSGEKGDKGDKGDPGLDGSDGVNGLPGADGVPGRDGVDGRNGLDGSDGVNGLPGADGVPGRDGVDGRNGLDGSDGVNGLPGADGVPGESATFRLASIIKVPRGRSPRAIERGTPKDRIYDLELPEEVEIEVSNVAIPVCDDELGFTTALRPVPYLVASGGNTLAAFTVVSEILSEILKEVCLNNNELEIFSTEGIVSGSEVYIPGECVLIRLFLGGIPQAFGRRFDAQTDAADKFYLGGLSFRVEAGLLPEVPIEWQISSFEVPTGSSAVKIYLLPPVAGSVSLYRRKV